jgi:hypothetical protein
LIEPGSVKDQMWMRPEKSMATIYEMTIFLAIALLAIVITVFVLAASLLGRAIEEARDQQKKVKVEEEEELTKTLRDLEQRLKQTKGSDDMQKLEQEIRNFKKKSRSLQRKLRLATIRFELLTVNGGVLPQALLFLLAMAPAGAARYLLDVRDHWPWGPPVLWAVSLLVLATGCYLVYVSLKAIEKLAMSTEEVQSRRMTEALRTALDQHQRARLPELRLEFGEKQPPLKFTMGTEEVIQVLVKLVSGDVAKQTELWFRAPKTFEFPGQAIVRKDDERHTFKTEPKSDLKKGLTWQRTIRVKSPSVKGTFEFEYCLLCEGFDGDWRKFTVEVV